MDDFPVIIEDKRLDNFGTQVQRTGKRWFCRRYAAGERRAKLCRSVPRLGAVTVVERLGLHLALMVKRVTAYFNCQEFYAVCILVERHHCFSLISGLDGWRCVDGCWLDGLGGLFGRIVGVAVGTSVFGDGRLTMLWILVVDIALTGPGDAGRFWGIARSFRIGLFLIRASAICLVRNGVWRLQMLGWIRRKVGCWSATVGRLLLPFYFRQWTGVWSRGSVDAGRIGVIQGRTGDCSMRSVRGGLATLGVLVCGRLSYSALHCCCGVSRHIDRVFAVVSYRLAGSFAMVLGSFSSIGAGWILEPVCAVACLATDCINHHLGRVVLYAVDGAWDILEGHHRRGLLSGWRATGERC